ncbi:GUN4 domain-containing protein [Dolichospermum circinale CS-539]|nr:GUN4 domain-containing protein [Dolichospermum circinale]MDB9466153.1 GUN4 domain-containing protein [Dolichospermum circinale CS-539/09]MDB9471720.1 GUN4 domain-containing protein [Dolichospermum circinale CS-539]
MEDCCIITYKFTVYVVSGQLKTKRYEGHFSYDQSQLNCNGDENIEVLEAQFRYQGVNYTESSFDGLPKISFKNGQFQNFIAVGGSIKRRFGFNDGFHRSQFRRPEEAFVREGKDYFAYLDPDTYVEGVGRVTYINIKQLASHTKDKPTQTTSNEIKVKLTELEKYLKAQQWKQADLETGRIILEIAGQLERGWLTDDDIENFPGAELVAIDKLWLNQSEARFGLSVQKQIWQEVGEDYLELCDRVGWRLEDDFLDYEDLEFSTQAPMGHLPFGGISVAIADEENWINQLPFHLPLWVSRSEPFMGCLYETRSGVELLKSLLFRTLLDSTIL